MNGPESHMEDELEIKRRMAREGPKVKKESDRPGKLMVSGIPKTQDFTKEQLENEFAAFGKVTEVNIIRDKRTGIARGFAFVTFENPSDAEDATKQMEGKDLGGENPIHCEQAVIGLVRQSQIATSRGRFNNANRARGGPWMERGRGGGGRGMDRGRGGMMERGGGFRGMRGGPPSRGGRGRGYGGEFYHEEDYYGGEQFDDGYGGGYPERGRGGPRGRPPQRGMMRGAPPGMRGRGGQPPMGGRGWAGPPEQGGGMRRPLLPSPAASRGGRGRGGPPPPPQDYYAEEQGYGEEYWGGEEEYYEEDPYNGTAGYAEDYQYADADGGYYGVPEEAPRPPAPRGRGAAPQRGRGGPPSHRGGAPPARGGAPSARGGAPPARGGAPPARGGAPSARGGAPPVSRGAPASSRGAPPARGIPRGAAASRGGSSGRQPPVDEYGYPEEPVRGPPRQRPVQSYNPESYSEDYYSNYSEAEPSAPAQDPYARPRAPTGRGQSAAPGRAGTARPPASRYSEDPYSTYGAGDGGQAYEAQGYDDYASTAPTRRGAAPPSGGRARQAEGYVDISEYIGQGSAGASAYRGQSDYEKRYPEREEGRRPAHPPREELYVGHGQSEPRDGYVSYPTSSYQREPSRKRPLEYVGGQDYDDYRRMDAPPKRERSGYDARQEGQYRGY